MKVKAFTIAEIIINLAIMMTVIAICGSMIISGMNILVFHTEKLQQKNIADAVMNRISDEFIYAEEITSEKNNDEKASKRIEEIKKTLEAEINKTRTYINVSDSKEENLFLNYVNNLIDYIIAAKYPGYQSDLAQIREITYTYAKISPEETHDLDLAPFKRQECYSRLAKIQLNAYLKIEEMVKMQEANNEEQISDNKQNHLEQQLKNSIDKKIEEILNTNLDDEKTCKENKDIQASPQLARVKIRTK